MQNRRPIQRPVAVSYRLLFCWLCCLAVLLSGCGTTPSSQSSSGSSSSSSAASPTAVPTVDSSATATATAASQMQARVTQLLQNMTLNDKIGQMIMVEFFGSDYQDTQLPQMIQQSHIGGYLYQPVNNNFDAPQNTVANVHAFAAQALQDSKIAPLVAIDQEGGLVSKLSTFAGSTPSAEALAQSGDPNVALQQGKKDAQLMAQLGINVDLAPVVDVGPDTNLLESRQFSSNAQTVITYAGAFLNGLQQNGTIGCMKHFPGLGSLSVDQDPHSVLPRDSRPLSEIESKDFVPYKAMIQQDHPAMIMSTNVITEAIDPNNPAELSRKAITDVLRKQLGYNGVIITDGLYMLENSGYMDMAPAAKQAIIAGNDMIEGPFTNDQVTNVIETVTQAVQDGELSQEQIDQSVSRILAMKLQYGIIQ